MLKQFLRTAGVVLAAVASLTLFVPAAQAQTEQQKLIADAEKVLSNFLRDPDMTWLQRNIGRSKALMIAPEILKAGFIFGGSGGRALVVARDPASGKWVGPAFYVLATGSVGFQAGISVSEGVTMVMTDKGFNSLLATTFKMGGDASVAAGPVGAGAKSDIIARRASTVASTSTAPWSRRPTTGTRPTTGRRCFRPTSWSAAASATRAPTSFSRKSRQRPARSKRSPRTAQAPGRRCFRPGACPALRRRQGDAPPPSSCTGSDTTDCSVPTSAPAMAPAATRLTFGSEMSPVTLIGMPTTGSPTTLPMIGTLFSIELTIGNATPVNAT
jgi:lipid-binding SYLF domain-containing protein